MNAQNENQKLLNNSESGPRDNSSMALEGFRDTGRMKKYEAISSDGIEFFFALSLEIAENMYKQMYPFRPLVEMEEISINY